MLHLTVDEWDTRSEDINVVDTNSTPPISGGLDTKPLLEILKILLSSKAPKLPPIAEETISSTIPVLTCSNMVLKNPLNLVMMSMPPVGTYSGESSTGQGGMVGTGSVGSGGQEGSSKGLSKRSNPFVS